MTKEELYELLDIESAEDFKYVENVAQYLECEDEIDFGVLAALINELDKDETAGLFDDYFEEIMEFIPEAETEIYGLFTNIRSEAAELFVTVGRNKPSPIPLCSQLTAAPTV